MTYDDFVSHFDVVQRDEKSARCRCPAHDDRKPSLSITRADDRTLVNCFAGCETEDILAAVGLTKRDLYFDNQMPTRTRRKIVDRYDYCDLNGEYAFTRVRYEPKDFRYEMKIGDHRQNGLGGRKRKDIPAVFCPDLEAFKSAIQRGETVFYVEGEKDVKTLDRYGYHGVTCGGANDWIPACAGLFAGGDVVIFADNDSPGRECAATVKASITPVASTVKIITPTPEIGGGDISNFFESHSIEDFHKLLQNPGEDHEPDVDRQQFHLVADSGRITGVFDHAILTHLKERENILIVGGTPFIYRDGRFIPDRNGAKLKTMIRDLIYPEFIRSTTIRRVYDLFTCDDELQADALDLNKYPVEWIHFANGFYDPVNNRMIANDAKYRSINQIPHTFDPNADLHGPMIDDWLSFITPNEDDREMLLQYCGYCLTRDTRQQKFLILNGEGGTGKSTVIRLLDAMIGADNISNISLNQLSQRFAAYGMMGKLLNSCADLELDALSDVSTIKKLLGEDTISAEAKGKDAISFRSYAKLIFSTNELPLVRGEKSNGFYRRLLVLEMQSIPPNRDPLFFDRLSKEIDYFVLLCVRALRRMYNNQTITPSSKSVRAVQRLRCDSDTVEAFLTDRTERLSDGIGSRIRKPELYSAYAWYCQEMGRQAHTKQNFYRTMTTKGYSEIKTGGDVWYRGIKFSANVPNSSPE